MEEEGERSGQVAAGAVAVLPRAQAWAQFGTLYLFFSLAKRPLSPPASYCTINVNCKESTPFERPGKGSDTLLWPLTGCALKSDQDLGIHKAKIPKIKPGFWLLGMNLGTSRTVLCVEFARH